MPTLQITHNDLDGCGCALIGRLCGINDCVYSAYNDSSKYYFPKVLKETFDPEKYNALVLTDINLTPTFVSILEELVPNDCYVTSADHHEDSLQAHMRWKIYHNKEISATRLMANIMDKKIDLIEYEDVIAAIDGFDTWNFDRSSMSLDLQRVFQYYIFMDESFKYVKYPVKLSNFVTLLEKETPVIDGFQPEWYTKCLKEYTSMKDPLVQQVINSSREFNGIQLYTFEKNSKCPAFEVSVHAMKNDIEHFILLFQDDETITVSLRTNSSELNLNEFALMKNGGGHAKAASFRIPLNQDILKSTLLEVSEFYRR